MDDDRFDRADFAMTWDVVLGVIANVAAVATAVVAVIAYGGYRYGISDRRTKLKDKLKAVAADHPNPQTFDLPSVSVLDLMLELRMTEAQVFEAALGDKEIVATSRGGPGDPLARSICFRYVH